MDESKPSLLSRILAIVVLVIIAVIAARLAIGAVAGLVRAVVWIAVLVALVGGALWARRTLKGGTRRREVEPAAPPALTYEDKVDAEMAKINEQLRKQGRGI
jgi:type VI protein secretion system component VasK